MFSDMPRKHYDEGWRITGEGLLDIIQRAGINVLWNDMTAVKAHAIAFRIKRKMSPS